MSKYILSYNLNSISYGYEKLPAQLNALGSALFIYRGLWLLKSDLNKNTICEKIKTSFASTDDFLLFEIEQSPLGTLSAQKYTEIQQLLDE
ncbi:hypothetical protein [Staphylococcus edaphicus]|uniref:Uncharacterized protein n=1 Tax=Staphylococcus edaphicus TaxID=1955013 RepID=A0A2C6WKL4_9STAP|nr:hypothetical protein [Staphylococcus edaphicus]PHK48635.1 hypothetical protein BTJ66_12385 [Staphylococcus edaphicus]UQW80927.1 hypothetical protein MNY58_10095 [Staphylococcus edaphicus]